MESHAKFLLQQAERCRRLAGQLTDRELARTLLDLGEEYEQRARGAHAERQCETRPDGRQPRPPRPIETAH